jgi:hypothetical protein
MIEVLALVNRGLSVIVPLSPAMVWHWMTVPGQSRGQTFFGRHVQPGFQESETGQAILKQFRRRLWWWCMAGAALSLLIPVRLASLVGCLIGSLAGWVAFTLANRRTQQEAHAAAGSTLRVASLVAESEPEGVWLSVVDWLAMLAPPVVPAATLTILALHWSQLSAPVRGLEGTFPVFFGLMLGFMCAANQWTLRFRARSSDWAPDPGASHKYRSYLGLMQALVFAFPICQICILVLMRSNGAPPYLRHVEMSTYFRVCFPAEALWLLCVWRMHAWLRKHLASESADPMPDACWKWGWMYFNPSDSALVVPVRTGVGQSFNCARPGVWVVCGAVTALTIASLVQSVGALGR